MLEVPDGATVEVFGPASGYNQHLTHPVAGFLVSDLDEAVAELRAAGVEIVLPVQDGGGRAIVAAPSRSRRVRLRTRGAAPVHPTARRLRPESLSSAAGGSPCETARGVGGASTGSAETAPGEGSGNHTANDGANLTLVLDFTTDPSPIAIDVVEDVLPHQVALLDVGGFQASLLAICATPEAGSLTEITC